jgi:hypothetical protein
MKKGSATTRNDIVLDYLKSGKTLTTLQAAHLFNISGLPVVIYRLRKEGWWIQSEMKQSYYNSRYAVYSLHPIQREGAGVYVA